jgi:ribosomal protein RSM22 (predicted rRNA methylase)
MIATLPKALSAVIDAETAQFSSAAIRDAAEALTSAYRAQSGIAATLSPIARAAYLAVRLPSTFAAAALAWRELAAAIDAGEIRTVLDAGAGPGTASLAAADVVPDLHFTLGERDAGWRAVAARLTNAAGIAATFHSIAMPAKLDPHDVVVSCYALNELPEAQHSSAVAELWRAAKRALIVLEPGTPKGFSIVRAVRAHALAEGGHAAAPCPHDLECPMTTADWCHRPVRVERSVKHRTAKRGTLAFEDEKFTYVVMTREPPARGARGRIVRKPIRNQGHVHIDLCTEGRIQRTTITRSDKQHYRAARDAEWGDAWPHQTD